MSVRVRVIVFVVEGLSQWVFLGGVSLACVRACERAFACVYAVIFPMEGLF
jgi:hypothetical protein